LKLTPLAYYGVVEGGAVSLVSFIADQHFRLARLDPSAAVTRYLLSSARIHFMPIRQVPSELAPYLVGGSDLGALHALQVGLGRDRVFANNVQCAVGHRALYIIKGVIANKLEQQANNVQCDELAVTSDRTDK